METYIKPGNILIDYVLFVPEIETVEHIVLQSIYIKERHMLETKIQWYSANKMTLQLILGNIKFRRIIISYLIDTGEYNN